MLKFVDFDGNSFNLTKVAVVVKCGFFGGVIKLAAPDDNR
jgi:hypothetical protein